MSEITVTITGPYFECPECHHPGPPRQPASITFGQAVGATMYYLIPHLAGCFAPNPFNGPAETLHFDQDASGGPSLASDRRVRAA